MPWGIVAGAAIGAIGSNLAAGKQASGQEAAANTQQNMFNTVNAQEQPFIQGGYGAENALLYGLGIGGGTPLNQVSTATPSGTPGMTYGIGPGGSIIPQLANTGGASLNQVSSAPPGMGYGSLTQQFT